MKRKIRLFKINLRHLKEKMLYFIVLVFSVVVVPLLLDNTYYIPLLLVLFIAPFLVLIKGFLKNDIPFLVLILTIMLTRVTNPENFRFATVAYSLMFILTFIYYTRLLKETQTKISTFQLFISRVVVAYAIVLLIQEISTALHIPVLNVVPNCVGTFKLNSLSYEPSHTGPILTILYYGYLKLEELKERKKLNLKDLYNANPKLFFSYFYVMLASLSVTCIFAMSIFLLYFVSKKHIIGMSVLIAVGAVVFFSLETEVGNRILELGPALKTLDAQALFLVDSSSAARIGPYLVYIQDFKWNSFNTWFGYGCDYGGLYLIRYLANNESIQENIGVGGVINFMYDYGLIAFIALLYCIHSYCKFRSFNFFLYITLFSICPINVYMLWLYFIVIATLNFFYRHKCSIITNSKFHFREKSKRTRKQKRRIRQILKKSTQQKQESRTDPMIAPQT